jgi:hypothetical protein
MKKLICFFIIFSMCFALYAFDRSLNGSWGLVKGSEKTEFIRFNTNEIMLLDTLFRSNDYEEANDTIYIDNFEGDSVIIQYHRLSQNKLLFIMWNTDNVEQSITLILTKL